MPTKQKIILITGKIGSGKSTLLSSIAHALKKRWNIFGCIAVGESRSHQSETPSPTYTLEILPSGKSLLWATQKPDHKGYDFQLDAMEDVVTYLHQQIASAHPEICVLDEIGKLEANGKGLATFFNVIRQHESIVIIAAIRKDILPELIAKFKLENATIIDLDETPSGIARKQALRIIKNSESGKIGTFAGIGGLVEVSLGSILHAYRIPLKGHFLAYLQNVFLIAIGNNLRGRGLIRISFIEAMLKTFSPIGSRVMPMLYIFLQGSVFALPSFVAGWNLFTVVLGSILMSWLTLGMWITVEYITYGKSFFEAIGGLSTVVSGWFSTSWSWQESILYLFSIKAVIASILALTAYYTDVLPFLRELTQRNRKRGFQTSTVTFGKQTWRYRLFGAIRDIFRWKFLLAFFFSVIVIFFFAKLSMEDAAILLLRGLCVSYIGFLLLRSLDIQLIAQWLDRKAGLGMSESLPKAIAVLSENQNDYSDNKS